ncbi:amino acid/amide ABC transporter substrate-binding protein, HAAT family [Trichlorobacter thiogenes]|uniref:Amino acid/amide ABC transporter substrate-binding protein, HAAT family n=1 Tax=Trichlorobacter thiogenes TaxID=115783 RepID=A0A1T4PCN3_9BACT|nr:ABC transporter substrate-binding protein [Trichlorobacter thiogenes]SJZ89313.1 amino acid/amide ABC transporter substrate-binding protein, HAAT family [Trichlorobacter thiogenes]
MRRLTATIWLLFLMLMGTASVLSAADTKPADLLADLTPADIHRLGERMYRQGLLSDGTPLRGFIRGDVPVDSTVFSCANCHTRSGLGAIEGQVAAPPVNGPNLFKPRYLYADFVKNTISASRGKTRPATAIRPAYTDETLAAALLAGVSATGRDFLPVMPRYNMGDRDMQILISYLKNLSAQVSPGITDTTMHLATIVTDDVSATDRAAMLAPLETLVHINEQRKTQRQDQRFAKMFRMLDNAYYRDLSISTWELKGPAHTWAAQLEAYYQKEPVFAIVSGISNQSWQPIHDFCEKRQIPNLFPVTDLPVISSEDWYTMYASKGYHGEGETVARYIASHDDSTAKRIILQIVVQSEQGKALAAGFDAAWKDVGNPGSVKTVTFQTAAVPDAKQLKALFATHKPTDVLIWGGEPLLNPIKQLSGVKKMPRLYLSGRALEKKLNDLPETLREKIFITYPFRLPEDEKAYRGFADVLLMSKQKVKDDKRITSRTFSAVHMLLLGLKEIKLDFYRDTLLDQVSMRTDQYLPDFERYSFGPGQRYASKGCYVVQLGSGSKPRLVKRSDWVVF